MILKSKSTAVITLPEYSRFSERTNNPRRFDKSHEFHDAHIFIEHVQES